MNDRSCTLADCAVSDPIRCIHCDEILGRGCPVEAYAEYVVVECLRCRCCTPFKLARVA